jgi:uncharacterized protein (DUF924 family)
MAIVLSDDCWSRRNVCYSRQARYQGVIKSCGASVLSAISNQQISNPTNHLSSDDFPGFCFRDLPRHWSSTLNHNELARYNIGYTSDDPDSYAWRKALRISKYLEHTSTRLRQHITAENHVRRSSIQHQIITASKGHPTIRRAAIRRHPTLPFEQLHIRHQRDTTRGRPVCERPAEEVGRVL